MGVQDKARGWFRGSGEPNPGEVPGQTANQAKGWGQGDLISV